MRNGIAKTCSLPALLITFVHDVTMKVESILVWLQLWTVLDSTENLISWFLKDYLWNVNVSVYWTNEKDRSSSSILTDILKKVSYIRIVVFRESFNLLLITIAFDKYPNHFHTSLDQSPLIISIRSHYYLVFLNLVNELRFSDSICSLHPVLMTFAPSRLRADDISFSSINR